MLVRLSKAGPSSRPARALALRRAYAQPTLPSTTTTTTTPAPSPPQPAGLRAVAPSPSSRTTSAVLRSSPGAPRISLPAHFGANQLVPVPEAKLAQLSSIVRSFRAPIRYAFAYGSGIFAQTPSLGDSPSADGKKKPMLDFIFATTHADHFHSINLQQNPSHYPGYARLAGSEAVSWVQRKGGAGVWFNAFCEVEGAMIKYGVITVDQLCKDLIEWETLYCSGRMHKPIRIIKDDPRVKLANQVNLASALRVALLTLPETFSERDLYERIAGLSYSGDPRMSIPGAENPRKVGNIVDAQMNRFQGVYGRLLSELDSLAVVGVPGGKLHQDVSPEHRALLARKLPITLKTAIRAEYAKTARADTASEAEAALWKEIGAADTLGAQLMLQTAKITRRPALTQSLKGIITTGPLKSLWYSSAKFSKWSAGRQQAPLSSSAPPSSKAACSAGEASEKSSRIEPGGKE